VLVVAALASCATGGRECVIAVLPEAGDQAATGPDDRETWVSGECRVLTGAQMLDRLPPGIGRAPASRRAEVLALMNSGESDFYGENSEQGKEKLLAGFLTLRRQPSLLPEDPGERDSLYRILLIVLRIEWEREKAAGDDVARWLAAHLPEQIPSVKRLPPIVAGRASAALEEVRRGAVRLSAPLPDNCGTGNLRMDGAVLGALPIAGRAVPQGSHAISFECGDRRSWVRTISLTEKVTLVGPEVTVEHLLRLGPAGMELSAGTVELRPAQLGARLAVSLDVDAVLMVPADRTSPASLAGPAGETTILFGTHRGQYLVAPAQVFHPRGQWMKTAKWTSLVAALLSGVGGASANMAYNERIDSMSHGTVDRRAEAQPWKSAAIAGYSVAGAVAAAAITFFVLDALPPEPVEPIF
jgi:hypothetical protein